jgi:hypothetical protein
VLGRPVQRLSSIEILRRDIASLLQQLPHRPLMLDLGCLVQQRCFVVILLASIIVTS